MSGTAKLTQRGNDANFFAGPMSPHPDQYESVALVGRQLDQCARENLGLFSNGSIDRDGPNYGDYFEFLDGDLSTTLPDYDLWIVIITDPNDSDGDGVPDLSDAATDSSIAQAGARPRPSATNDQRGNGPVVRRGKHRLAQPDELDSRLDCFLDQLDATDPTPDPCRILGLLASPTPLARILPNLPKSEPTHVGCIICPSDARPLPHCQPVRHVWANRCPAKARVLRQLLSPDRSQVRLQVPVGEIEEGFPVGGGDRVAAGMIVET